MSGQNAKTNFPISKSSSGDPLVDGGDVSKSSSTDLAAILNAKLRKCCKAPSPSLTCLRLDTENSHIGVWQKRAGTSSDSNWVMTIELGKKNTKSSSESSSSLPDTPMEGQNDNVEGGKMEEEDRIALQMIEELLFKNTPGPSGEASLQV